MTRVTARPVRIENWRNHGPVDIPAGLTVSEGETHYVEEVGRVFNFGTHSDLFFEALRYGLPVPADQLVAWLPVSNAPEPTLWTRVLCFLM